MNTSRGGSTDAYTCILRTPPKKSSQTSSEAFEMVGVGLPTRKGDRNEDEPFDALSESMTHGLLPETLHGSWRMVAPSKLSGFEVSTPHFDAPKRPKLGPFVTIASVNVNVGSLEEDLGTGVPSRGKDTVAAGANEEPSVGL